MQVDARTRRNILLLGTTAFCVGLAMAMNGALYNNFLPAILGKGNYAGFGRVEAIRETPGILSAAMNGAVSHLPEPVVAALAIAVLGLGYAGYYWATGVGSLIGMSFLWSCGFHAWAPLSGALGVSLAPEDSRGELLGKIASAGAVGTVAGYLTIALAAVALHTDTHSLHLYKWMYFAAGLVGLIGAAAVYRISHDVGCSLKPRMIIRRRYGLYYILQALEGGRKQVFITFAAFVLVLRYHADPKTMAILLLINYVIAFAVAPTFGRWIDRIGERKVLSANYIALILVFIGYATISSIWGLYALFCLDNVLFTFSIALTTYVGKIAPENELTPTLAMGTTSNHLIAVVVPLIGFALWTRYGYQVCFVGGAAVVGLQLLAVQWLRIPQAISAIPAAATHE